MSHQCVQFKCSHGKEKKRNLAADRGGRVNVVAVTAACLCFLFKHYLSYGTIMSALVPVFQCELLVGNMFSTNKNLEERMVRGNVAASDMMIQIS